MVSQTLLEELKIIIKEDYGIELPQDELSDFGNFLVTLYELLAKMDQKNKDGETDNE